MKRVFTPVKKKTVLIVDDDQILVHLYREKFQSRGLKVEVAGDGVSAMQRFKTHVVDLVILDLCLPGTDAVSLIKNIRSNFDRQSLPVIAFSNPYLNNVTRDALEAGATKCLVKVDGTPEQVFEIMRELGVGGPSRVVLSPVVGTLEPGRGQVAATLLMHGAEKLAKLRASYQAFATAEQDGSRRADLLTLHRHLRSLAGGASFLGFGKIAQMSTALEALFIELRTKPSKITPSVVRTVAQAIDTLATLFDRAANPGAEIIATPKILVVDDEIISRETICSALGKAGLQSESLDDSLAAQRLLEQDHFDLIFLDVEMPGQTGLELCLKIREMAPNCATPVVFVTSHSDFGSRAQSTLSGGNDFIAKPFLLVELAVKALTWLCKGKAQPLSIATSHGANINERQTAKAGLEQHSYENKTNRPHALVAHN